MKRKNSYIIALCIIVLLLFVGLAVGLNNSKAKPNNIENGVEQETPIIEEPKEKTLEEKVDEEISQMTLDEKIGQLFIVAYRKLGYNDELDNILNKVKPCGFILFGENIDTYKNTTEYIKKIKSTSTIPMFIGIDQEGGLVQRIKKLSDANVLTIPNMYRLGKTNDVQLAKNVGKVIGEEIAAFGINLDFAPVIDVFSNSNNTVIGNRAFGKDANTVIKMALPFSEGLKSAGVIPCFKHFPGHGDTTADSHVQLPVVNKTKEALYKMELLPFKAAVENGAEMIMTAHIAMPKITGNYVPATLSKDIVDGILRKELNYNGVVITDAVEMKAITDNYTIKQVCNLAINAGVDIILIPTNPILAVKNMKELVNEGKITEERINESVKRILLLKHKNGLYEEKQLNKQNIGTEEHKQIINKLNNY